jgi:SAM-dependent methyltransferase
MEGFDMDQNSVSRTNIIGAGEVGSAVSVDMDKNLVHRTNSYYWDSEGNDFLGAIVLPLYGAFVSEEKYQLFGEVSGKKVLEIGCGNGRSLQYLGERNASELWGVDLSEKQIEKATKHLEGCSLPAKLICSPMEDECGIPVDYFDFVYSIYAIGWTTDLEGTFSRIASYLKKDGVFIFSWSHPIHKCVAAENNVLAFKKCYFDESWYSVSLDDGTLTISDRKLSTYVNALAKAGFVIEQMIEDSDDEIIQGQDSDFAKKAKMLPVTFVVKARKL